MGSSEGAGICSHGGCGRSLHTAVMESLPLNNWTGRRAGSSIGLDEIGDELRADVPELITGKRRRATVVQMTWRGEDA
jgi:hypothetical protein